MAVHRRTRPGTRQLTPAEGRTRRRSRPRGVRGWLRSRRVRRRAKRVLKWAAIAVGVVLFLCLVSAAFVGPSTFKAARDGRVALIEGSRAVLRRDAAAARVEFSEARDLFTSAGSKLRSPLAWPLRLTPVASTHVGVARSLSRIGAGVANAGVAISDTMTGLPEESLAFKDGRVNLDEVRRSANALRIAAEGSAEISDAIADMPTGWVGGPLVVPRAQAREMLPPILEGVRNARAALDGLPGILAEGGRKRYLVAFSNLSELRGSGGLFGFVTALEAENGDLDLEDFSGRPTEVFPSPGSVGLEYPDWFPEDLRTQAKIFQNINMSTDFPTVGRFVTRTAEAELGDLDGVIAVDPIGIGAILGLTGPISVPTWPRAISADNVAKIAMHDVYVSITNNETRERFFEELVRTAFAKLTSSTVRLSADSAGLFDRSVRGGHFRMYSDHAQDQAVFDAIGASGAVARATGATDVLSVVSENAGGNKVDWFLRRDIRYLVQIDPASGEASSILSTTFRNTAPGSGLPDYIIGSPLEGLPAGTNRQIVMLLRSPRDVTDEIAIDDRFATKLTSREGALSAYRTTVDIAARSRSQLLIQSRIPNALAGEGDDRVYRLHVLRQAVATPDFAEIEITVPSGWEAVGQTSFTGDLTQDVVLEVRVRRTLRGALIREPLETLKRLLDRVF